MKKILGVLTIIVLLVSVCFYFFPKQPKNIFDEIYQETEKTYRSNNILRNIEGFEIDDVWPSDGEYFKYSPLGKYNTKTITQLIQIVLSGKEDSYIEDEAQVKSYLEKYGITAKDLDSYYDEIVNQKVLKDWCSIYDSKYSPSNYGEVKVETQWENW